MKILKKYFIFIIILFLFTSCRKVKIELPSSTDLSYIKVTKIENKIDEKESFKIENKEEIENFLFSLSGATKTNKQSISDTPTNVDVYFKVDFEYKKSKNEKDVLYIYKSKKYLDNEYIYFEKPYIGIFKDKLKNLKNIKFLDKIK